MDLILVKKSTGELLTSSGASYYGNGRTADPVSVRSLVAVAVRFLDDSGNRTTLNPAAGVLTFASQPAVGDTFTIGAATYTAAADASGGAYMVALGTNLATFIANLVGAINLSTSGGQAAGATYGTNTAANTAASAAAYQGTKIVLTARYADASGNAVATSTTSAHASFGAATLSGGEVLSFDIKPDTLFDADFTIPSPVFAAPLNPATGDYAAILNTNVPAAIALLDPNNTDGAHPNAAEPPSAPLMAQLSWRAGNAAPSRSDRWALTLTNVLRHDSEGTPPIVPPALTTAALQTAIAQAGAAEPGLGNPSARGKVLTSSPSGVRAWVAPDDVFNVVRDFGGSGSPARTTGSVSAGSAVLAAQDAGSFVPGHGICVIGAGAAGTNLVTTVAAVAGNTVTLAAPAATAVAAARVQHDDTAAINAALAAAFNAHGGRAHLALGTYRCAGAFAPGTNSVLTCPQNLSYTGVPPCVVLSGSSRGALDGALLPAGGVVIDATDCPAAPGPNAAVIAGAATADTSGSLAGFNRIDLRVENLTVLVRSNPDTHGINLGNCMQGSVGNCRVLTQYGSDGATFAEPIHAGVTGIILPQVNNNYHLACIDCQVAGFPAGLLAGEHARLEDVVLTSCKIGLAIPTSNHAIRGSLVLEACTTFIAAAAGCTGATLDLHVQVEMAEAGHWWSTTPRTVEFAGSTEGGTNYFQYVGGSGIVDADSVLRGDIAYALVVANMGRSIAEIPFTGCAGLTLRNQQGRTLLQYRTDNSTPQSFPDSTPTPVQLQTRLFDRLGEWDADNNVFKVRRSGKYRFTASVWYDALQADGIVGLAVIRHAAIDVAPAGGYGLVQWIDLQRHGVAGSQENPNGGIVLDLVPDDTVGLVAYPITGQTENMLTTGGDQTILNYLCVEEL